MLVIFYGMSVPKQPHPSPIKPFQLTRSAKPVLELQSIAESPQVCSYIDCGNSQKGDA
jgi:hypothetical protein